MKFPFSRTLFVPVVLTFFLFLFSSCDKDYDLVSEYMVREVNETSHLANTEKQMDAALADKNASTKQQGQKSESVSGK
jgi:hypothetical protein